MPAMSSAKSGPRDAGTHLARHQPGCGHADRPSRANPAHQTDSKLADQRIRRGSLDHRPRSKRIRAPPSLVGRHPGTTFWTRHRAREPTHAQPAERQNRTGPNLASPCLRSAEPKIPNLNPVPHSVAVVLCHLVSDRADKIALYRRGSSRASRFLGAFLGFSLTNE